MMPNTPCRFATRRALLATSFALAIAFGNRALLADEGDADASSSNQPAPTRYSPAVEAKAEAILKEAGLRRSGKTLIADAAAELAREMSGLSKQRRELVLQQKEYATAQSQIGQMEEQLRLAETKDGELNLQLARVAGTDVLTNNRIVALINANRTRMKQLRSQRTQAEETTADLQAKLNSKEAEYAETVFQLRKSLDNLREEVAHSTKDEKVQIAIRVMNANHGVPMSISPDDILQTIELRLAKIEQEVFSESIPLEKERSGSMHVTVSVNNQTVRMMVDSGATLVTLPASVARELDISIPADAKRLRLVLANGDELSAQRVTLESVRVGQFEAKDVECAILEPIEAKVEPLLGMSYLGEFKFEIDAVQKTLRMLRVETSQ
ncbi:TIGR02281 family clan AA aspartic protease [Rhodopirellula sp. JC740]|uniref:TIGR02281 family clan AA aspartic protease n=1 Tax=Rhodopirellula halodulae TaxID=2894198 RepID=A0ABS8NBK2_9BACT|nr:retropepsin-like aspartic protease [Rhodopirellula sp. JC740]MCC9640940.1 TIGR02281 family clan AA aspartic protease [Rhodopirellula sp. JC740]